VARALGAAALLIVTGPRTRGVGDVLVPFQTDAALSDVGIPVLSLRRGVAADLLYGTGLDLAEAQGLADSGGAGARRRLAVALELQADLEPLRALTSNVLGRLAGRSSETLVVGAHYDHLGRGGSGSLDPGAEGAVHHGADDNASGTAALLELARALAARSELLERSVVFAAFGAEELGLLGSLHFVEHPPLPLEQVVAMLNLDMVGRLDSRGLVVQGRDTSPAWAELLEAANGGPQLRLRLMRGGSGPSDHAPFFHAGIPVLFFFTGMHADYHRPSDTSDRVDATGISRILSLVEPIALAVAGTQVALPFRDPSAPH
jgi:Zn-dependent M28 family amino/carboxypeptidase